MAMTFSGEDASLDHVHIGYGGIVSRSSWQSSSKPCQRYAGWQFIFYILEGRVPSRPKLPPSKTFLSKGGGTWGGTVTHRMTVAFPLQRENRSKAQRSEVGVRRNLPGASQSPERREGMKPKRNNETKKGKNNGKSLSRPCGFETRSQGTNHSPKASLGWRPETASSSVGSDS